MWFCSINHLFFVAIFWRTLYVQKYNVPIWFTCHPTFFQLSFSNCFLIKVLKEFFVGQLDGNWWPTSQLSEGPVVRKLKSVPVISSFWLFDNRDRFSNFLTTAGPSDKWDVSGNPHHARGTISKQSIYLKRKLGSRKKNLNYEKIKAGVINHHSIQKI